VRGCVEAQLPLYDVVIGRFGRSRDPDLRRQIGWALLAKHRALDLLGRPAESLEAIDELVARLHDEDDDRLRWQVAAGLIQRGVTLHDLGRNDEAIVVYDAMLERFGDEDDHTFDEPVARALLGKVTACERLERGEDAAAAGSELAARFGDNDKPRITECVASGLLLAGYALAEVAQIQQDCFLGWDAFAHLCETFSATDGGEAQQLALCLANVGIVVGERSQPQTEAKGRYERAIALLDDLVARFGASDDVGIQVEVAQALTYKGQILDNRLARSEDALTVFDDVLERINGRPGREFVEREVRVLTAKGLALAALGRSDEAVGVHDAAILRLADTSEPRLRELAATSLTKKGATLVGLDRGDDALAAFTEIVRRFGSASEGALREHVARALLARGSVLVIQGRGEAALSDFDETLRRFASAPEPGLREPVFLAFLNKASQEDLQGRPDAALAQLDSLVERYDGAAEPLIRSRICLAFLYRGGSSCSSPGMRPPSLRWPSRLSGSRTPRSQPGGKLRCTPCSCRVPCTTRRGIRGRPRRRSTSSWSDSEVIPTRESRHSSRTRAARAGRGRLSPALGFRFPPG
jgi:tetratricopeptide (TPR) repeat protein